MCLISKTICSMKKIACLLLLFVTFQVSAQEFHFIPKIGLNFANMTNSDGSMKPGLNIGVAGEVMMTNNFAIEPGIFYSMQGAKGKGESSGLKIKNDYLNIPVLAKFYVWEGVSVDLGPQLGFALNGKNKTKSGGTEVKTDIDHLNTVDLSFAMGLSYDFNMGLVVSARYNLGLTNVIEKDKFGGNNQNRVFQLSAGWKF